MTAVRDLAPEVGVQRACRALLLPRASYYRARQATSCAAPPVATPPGPATPHPRALGKQERTHVRGLFALRSLRRLSTRGGPRDAARRGCLPLLAPHHVPNPGRPPGDRERRNQLERPVFSWPELLATAPNQVWSWDITKLLGPATWTYFYLYVILDIFSRYVVGWMLADAERASLATRLINETCAKQAIEPAQLTIHTDRGASKPVAFLLADLGVTKSHSRPHTSNDNPFSESHFKTLKYRQDFSDPFASKEHAHYSCRDFFSWCNLDHRHSGTEFLTPHTSSIMGSQKKSSRPATQPSWRPTTLTPNGSLVAHLLPHPLPRSSSTPHLHNLR